MRTFSVALFFILSSATSCVAKELFLLYPYSKESHVIFAGAPKAENAVNTLPWSTSTNSVIDSKVHYGLLSGEIIPNLARRLPKGTPKAENAANTLPWSTSTNSVIDSKVRYGLLSGEITPNLARRLPKGTPKAENVANTLPWSTSTSSVIDSKVRYGLLSGEITPNLARRLAAKHCCFLFHVMLFI